VRLNSAAVNTAVTHEGAKAGHQKPTQALFRAVSTCLLWESAFYESGSAIAKNIEELCSQVSAEDLAAVAIEARQRLNLRHVPLFLVRQLAKLHKGPIVGDTVAAVLRRPDEATEFLALWWKDGRGETAKLSSQVKRGLRLAFAGWDEYRLAKYAGAGDKIKLRDALFLSHAKPKDEGQAALWKRFIAGDLAAPDTWEVALSAGADKKLTWERLIREHRLGYKALLMNLRNMEAVGVDRRLVGAELLARAAGSKEFPYQFISAANACPGWEPEIDAAMLASLADAERLAGSTLLVVDTSGSMRAPLSAKSTLDRIDAACGLAVLIRELCEDATVYVTAGNDYTRVHATAMVPARRGMALRAAIKSTAAALGGGGIFLKQCMDFIASAQKKPFGQKLPFDRVLVFTDEQDCDKKANPATAQKLGRFNYINNVAPYKPGIDITQGWARINGWSDRVVDWILMEEAAGA
jgi:hypothetical protein